MQFWPFASGHQSSERTQRCCHIYFLLNVDIVHCDCPSPSIVVASIHNKFGVSLIIRTANLVILLFGILWAVVVVGTEILIWLQI